MNGNGESENFNGLFTIWNNVTYTNWTIQLKLKELCKFYSNTIRHENIKILIQKV